MPSHYTDSEDSEAQSQFSSNYGTGSSSRRSDRTGWGGASAPPSYTDRFRVDTPYDQPRVLHGSGVNSIARLKQLIERACRPSLQEPDLSVNLQIADIINDKKGNAPREAANTIVQFVNNRNQHVAILAISVLDVCVKNCGYPFHLQISRKDFLNELVRRFPEKPPLHYSRIQLLILECIEEWKVTLAASSKHRDDFGYIRDMHRLLSYKGYMFPEINRDDAAVLNAGEGESLKSAAELEEEDRLAQEAKLQELLRSGNPDDLREANHLMSIMAGLRDSKVDYRAKVAQELDKLRRKAEILEEMLNAIVPDEPVANDDVVSELVGSLKTAQPKLDKIVDDETDGDPEAVQRVEELRSYTKALIEKYDFVTKRDFESANKVEIAPGTSGRKIDISRQAVLNSLIDIDDEPTAPATGSTGGGSATDDLLGLSLGGLSLNTNAPAGVVNSSPFDTGSSQASPSPNSMSATVSNGDLLGELLGTPTPPSGSSGAASSLTSHTTAGPATHHKIYEDEAIKIDMNVTRTDVGWDIEAVFSNCGSKKITNLRFEAAQPKQFTLTISPQTSTNIEALQEAGVRQKLQLQGQGPPRLRWRATFNWGIEQRSATGQVKDL